MKKICFFIFMLSIPFLNSQNKLDFTKPQQENYQKKLSFDYLYDTDSVFTDGPEIIQLQQIVSEEKEEDNFEENFGRGLIIGLVTATSVIVTLQIVYCSTDNNLCIFE